LKASGFAPYLEMVFEALGVAGVMIGADWPVCAVAAPYARGSVK